MTFPEVHSMRSQNLLGLSVGIKIKFSDSLFLYPTSQSEDQAPSFLYLGAPLDFPARVPHFDNTGL